MKMICRIITMCRQVLSAESIYKMGNNLLRHEVDIVGRHEGNKAQKRYRTRRGLWKEKGKEKNKDPTLDEASPLQKQQGDCALDFRWLCTNPNIFKSE